MLCRFCKSELKDVFVDLGNAPPSNSFLKEEELNMPEVYYPLKVYTCSCCFLVQLDEYKKSGSIFNNNYVYFSSYSRSWLAHAKQYAEMMIKRFGFDKHSLVIELASNDGYLLQYFLEKGISVLGIEPTENTAKEAVGKGIQTIVEFFGVKLAENLVKNHKVKADLLIGNNVLAHVPDIVDFVSGMKIILSEKGIITMEFPHLMQLIEQSQFDTIYHEHFSYLSLNTVKQIFESCGLELFDVEQISTHGGSLRIFAKHIEDDSKTISTNIAGLLFEEFEKGMTRMEYYNTFQRRVLKVKLDFIDFLIKQKRNGKKIAAYGAAAKGNTLLNYCGIKNDLVSYVADANPHKQNKYLPASHIPVVDENFLKSDKPDYVLIFPWNLKEEITSQLSYIKAWGGNLVISIPELQII